MAAEGREGELVWDYYSGELRLPAVDAPHGSRDSFRVSAVAAANRPTPSVSEPRAVAGLAVRPLLVVLVAKCALNFAFAGRYGWQRDELYYAVAGHHLQGGYLEFPPVTVLLSAVARVLFGYSLVGFRSFAILAGAATIVLAALVARELGGGRRAQVIAAAAVAFSNLLGFNGLF